MSEEAINEATKPTPKTGQALKLARKKCEEKIYKAFKILDPTGQNTEYYKNKFAHMSDKEFLDFFKNEHFPLKFQTKVFEIDPRMTTIMDFLKFLGVPVIERIAMPFLYSDKDGNAVQTQEVLVVYLSLKRMKQAVQLKSHSTTDINKRDYRTGLLIGDSKVGSASDREIESMVVFGLDKSLRELTTVRADALKAKSEFYSAISTTGFARLSDVDIENEDSIARNLISAYLLGAHINSNLINKDDYLYRTLVKKSGGKQGGLKRKE